MRFLGQREDVPRLMAAADVFCQPNTGPEPFGIVLVEALYAGLPVVTSGFGGAAEIVDQTCGVLTAPGDARICRGHAAGLDPGPVEATGAGGCWPRPGAVAVRPGPSAQRCGRAPATGEALERKATARADVLGPARQARGWTVI